VHVNEDVIYERIKQALSAAPRNQYTAELHLQMIKYADDLKTITAKEFCEGVGLRSSFGTEFSKMRNLVGRLKAAGMDTTKLWIGDDLHFHCLFRCYLLSISIAVNNSTELSKFNQRHYSGNWAGELI